MHPVRADRLCELRQSVAGVDARHAGLSAAEPALALGVAAIDAALGGGLAFGALHELAPALPLDAGAATGFAAALAALTPAQHPLLWIQSDFGRAEGGVLYGPGLDLFGFGLDRLIILTVAKAADVLWAMEEALRSRAVRIVVGEMADERHADDRAIRRLSLTAREAGGLGLLLRPRASCAPSAAATRWQIATAPGMRDEFGGLGRTTFALSLTKNRRGPCGRWLVAWDHHDHVFHPALSVGVVETARDRPDRAPLARIG
jgi:protein ImuA